MLDVLEYEKLEDLLIKLMEHVNSTKYSGLRDSCRLAFELLKNNPQHVSSYHDIRNACFAPFKIAYESDSTQLAILAICGFQKLQMDKRLSLDGNQLVEDDVFFANFISGIHTTPNHPEEVKKEVLKFLKSSVVCYGDSISIEHLIKLLEILEKTHDKSIQKDVKSLCKTAMHELLYSFCGGSHCIGEKKPLKQGLNDYRSCIVLKYVYEKLQSQKLSEKIDPEESFEGFYLESIASILPQLSESTYESGEFIRITREILCPVLMGILKTLSANSSGNISEKDVTEHSINYIYPILTELVRFLGRVCSFQPVLSSLFQCMFSYSETQHQLNTLKIVKKIFSSPHETFNLAGISMINTDMNIMPFSSNQRKLELELFHTIIKGILELCEASDSCVVVASVSCVVTLLSTLEEVGSGRGLCNEHVAMLVKSNSHDLFTSCKNEENDDSYIEAERGVKPKHIRWLMDYEEKTMEEVQGEKQKFLEDSSRDDQSRRGLVFPTLKFRDHSYLQGCDLKPTTSTLKRSQSALEIRSSTTRFPLRKTSSTSKLEVKEKNVLTAEIIKTRFKSKETKRPLKSKYNLQKHCSSNQQNKQTVDYTGDQVMKHPKPILRNFRQQIEHKTHADERDSQKIENVSPSKETTINGIPLSKLPRQKSRLHKTYDKITRIRSKQNTVSNVKELHKKSIPNDAKILKTSDEHECEGARNFARCLLGILPSVLSATKPSDVDELLQQFSSDVCEAVACMILKRKTVPDFGISYSFEIKPDDEISTSSSVSDPMLNADVVYKTVFETLKLNYYLITKGHYKKSGKLSPSQDKFIQSVIDFKPPIRLSRLWLSEVYRLVTTYDILSKAGYKGNTTENDLPLIAILSENLYKKQLYQLENVEQFVVENTCSVKKTGVQFAKDLLSTTWEMILNTLANTLILTTSGDEKSEKQPHQELISLTLDGLRRAARLCSKLEMQFGCDLVLSHLSQASCSLLKDNNLKVHNGTFMPIALHAAQVLSMDALLAVGLELGSHAPHAWNEVLRVCIYISNLEQIPFEEQSSVKPMSANNKIKEDISLNSTNSTAKEEFSLYSGLLSTDDTSRAVYALSNAVDNLFDMAATVLPLHSFKDFLESLVTASHEQISSCENREEAIVIPTLYLHHISDVMIRCANNNVHSLLYCMEAWNVVATHLTEAVLSRSIHISRVALTSLHDIIHEFLKRRTELHHFCFYETLFRPFEMLMEMELCSEDTKNQILFAIFELVQAYGTFIRSGWRPIFQGLSHINLSSNFKYLLDCNEERRMFFDIVEVFIQLRSVNVFATGAVNCVLCLLKCIQGGSYYEKSSSSYEEIYDETAYYSQNTVAEEEDSCLISLNLLSQISQRLSIIYIQPATNIFHGSHDIVLVNLLESQSKIWNDTWCFYSSSKCETHERKDKIKSTASSIIAIDETGILRVWFLIMEGLTSKVINSKCHQQQIIELLFEIMNSISKAPGPHFSMFIISNLLLPMLKSWVDIGSRMKGMWEKTFQNFKHAFGVATQLIVDEIGQFLQVEGAKECVPTLLKQLLDLFHDCVSKPIESVARLGCSCLRHLLLSVGPQLTEELWTIICLGIKKIVLSTLLPIQQLLTCYQAESLDLNGGRGHIVKIVARRNVKPSEALRILQLAEKVFLLDSQVFGNTPQSESELGEEDGRSYSFILSPLHEDEENEDTEKRISFQEVIVTLLSNQILTQMLGCILLETSDSVQGPIISSINDSGILRKNQEETSLPGLLFYLSAKHLNIIFDCLLENYSIAQEFNIRPGLRCLIQKLARFNCWANLFRTSIPSFAFYLNTLFEISKYDCENISMSNIKRILIGEKISFGCNVSESDENVKGPENIALLRDSDNIDWVIRRLHDACNQITTTYQQLHQAFIFTEEDSGFSEHFSSNSSSPYVSPKHHFKKTVDEKRKDESYVKTLALKITQSPFRLKMKNGCTDVTSQGMKRKEDDLLHLSSWSQLITSMLELLLALPVLQFKSVLPAVFPAVTSLVANAHDKKVRKLVSDVVQRSGKIYGIM